MTRLHRLWLPAIALALIAVGWWSMRELPVEPVTVYPVRVADRWALVSEDGQFFVPPQHAVIQIYDASTEQVVVLRAEWTPDGPVTATHVLCHGTESRLHWQARFPFLVRESQRQSMMYLSNGTRFVVGPGDYKLVWHETLKRPLFVPVVEDEDGDVAEDQPTRYLGLDGQPIDMASADIQAMLSEADFSTRTMDDVYMDEWKTLPDSLSPEESSVTEPWLTKPWPINRNRPAIPYLCEPTHVEYKRLLVRNDDRIFDRSTDLLSFYEIATECTVAIEADGTVAVYRRDGDRLQRTELEPAPELLDMVEVQRRKREYFREWHHVEGSDLWLCHGVEKSHLFDADFHLELEADSFGILAVTSDGYVLKREEGGLDFYRGGQFQGTVDAFALGYFEPDGRALAYVRDPERYGHMLGIVDHNGRWVVEPQTHVLRLLPGGHDRYLIQYNGLFRLMDMTGKVVFRVNFREVVWCEPADVPTPLLCVQMRDRQLVINLDGKVILTGGLNVQECRAFGGILWVQIGDAWLRYSRAGERLPGDSYTDFRPTAGGAAQVTTADGRVGVVRPDGTWVLEPTLIER